MFYVKGKSFVASFSKTSHLLPKDQQEANLTQPTDYQDQSNLYTASTSIILTATALAF